MTSTSQKHELARNARTVRTGSTWPLSLESAFNSMLPPSDLCARVQIALEGLITLLTALIQTGGFSGFSSAHTSAQNARTVRTDSTGPVSLESALKSTLHPSDLCAPVQISLESLSSSLVAPFGHTKATLHSIGIEGGYDLLKSPCGVSILAVDGDRAAESVCSARCRQATGRPDPRCNSCQK